MKKGRALLKSAPPFDFDLTVGHNVSFQSRQGEDRQDSGVYRQLIELDDRLLLASARSTGVVESPELEVEVSGEATNEGDAEAAAEKVAWILGTDIKLQGYYAIAREDPVISFMVQELYGLHPTRAGSVFEALVLAIMSQQIAANVARLIHALTIETYGRQLSVDGHVYHAFPTPEAILSAGVEGLKAVKLSTRKAEYILDIASKVASGSLRLEGIGALSDEGVQEQVMGLRGVGRWTSQWLLIRALGRPDAFPSGDLALRRIISNLYFGGQAISDPEAEEFSRRWSPHRSLATIYFFAAARKGLVEI